MNRTDSGGGIRRPRAQPATYRLPLLVAVLLGTCFGSLYVRESAHLGRGVYGELGCVIPFRCATENPPLIVFYGAIPGTWGGLHFYSYAPPDNYELAKVDTGNLSGQGGFIPGNLLPWATGDLNGDSSPELIGYNADYSTGHGFVTAYVTPAGSDIPDSLRARARYDGLAGGGIFHFTDLDLDGRKEIAFWGCDHEIVSFEWENDSLHKVISVPCDNGADVSIGDFDEDGLIEVATTGLSWDNWVIVYKCTGNNVLVPWDSTPITRINGRMFAASNLDGSHRAVIFATYFIVGGYAYLYEVMPTNETHDYQPILIDSTLDAGEVYAHSVCGDIDGDGLDEVLWSTGNQIRAYRHTGPHQYELIWNWWNWSGARSSCNLNLYDMNGNGYNEILESGEGVTNIFEIEAIHVLNPNRRITLHPSDTCRIRWQTFNPPPCDSISLFLRSDTAWRLDTLTHGLPPTDTSWVWTVPDIRSDSCRIVAIAYGPGWQYDESDTCFRIAPVGVEERPPEPTYETGLVGAFPNPLTTATSIQFQLREQSRVSLRICDVSGRTVATLADGVMKPGFYRRDWEVAPTVPNGVYFLDFTAGSYRTAQKLVLAR